MASGPVDGELPGDTAVWLTADRALVGTLSALTGHFVGTLSALTGHLSALSPIPGLPDESRIEGPSARSRSPVQEPTRGGLDRDHRPGHANAAA